MKYFFLIISLFTTIKINSQSKIKFGASYQSGISSILAQKNTTHVTNGIPATEFSYKSFNACGIHAQYLFIEKFALGLNVSYASKGAYFDKDASVFTPRYKVNYADAALSLNYFTKPIIKASKLNFGLGLLAGKLLNAYRENSYAATNIKVDVKPYSYSAFASIGWAKPCFNKDELQINIIGNYGLSNIFQGFIADAGTNGKLISFGLQLNYLLGFNLKNK